MFSKDLKDLIHGSNENGVEYLLVGGYTFGVHAQPCATKELDLFIRSSVRNTEAVFKALGEFGAPLHGMTINDFRDGETCLEFGRSRKLRHPAENQRCYIRGCLEGPRDHRILATEAGKYRGDGLLHFAAR